MSKIVSSLTIRAIDEYNNLLLTQQLIDICLERLDEYSQENQDRAGLLLDCYRSRMSLHLDELRTHLQRLLLFDRVLPDV